MFKYAKTSARLLIVLLAGFSTATFAAEPTTMASPARLLCHKKECKWEEAIRLPAEGGTIELRCRSSEYPWVDEYAFSKTPDINCNEWETRLEYRVVACRSKAGAASIANVVLFCRMKGE